MNKISRLNKEMIFNSFEPRRADTHKGDYGRALIIAGSYGMAGAAIIAARGCVSSGIGICEIICPHSVYPIIATAVNEAVFTPVDDNNLDISSIIRSVQKADCVVIGCGMGQTDYTDKMLDIVIEYSNKITVIDADGLNCLARRTSLLQNIKGTAIMTPHPKEASRLLGCEVNEILKEPIISVSEFSSRFKSYCVLKLHETIICEPNGDIYINPTGNAGMATGGSGDLLCGILAGLLCNCDSVTKAVCSAVYIHGAVGDATADLYSQICTTPSLMIDMLPCIYKQIEDYYEQQTEE